MRRDLAGGAVVKTALPVQGRGTDPLSGSSDPTRCVVQPE